MAVPVGHVFRFLFCGSLDVRVQVRVRGVSHDVQRLISIVGRKRCDKAFTADTKALVL